MVITFHVIWEHWKSKLIVFRKNSENYTDSESCTLAGCYSWSIVMFSFRKYTLNSRYRIATIRYQQLSHIKTTFGYCFCHTDCPFREAFSLLHLNKNVVCSLLFSEKSLWGGFHFSNLYDWLEKRRRHTFL